MLKNARGMAWCLRLALKSSRKNGLAGRCATSCPCLQGALRGVAEIWREGAWDALCTMGPHLGAQGGSREGLPRATATCPRPRGQPLTCDDGVHALVEKGHGRRAGGGRRAKA